MEEERFVVGARNSSGEKGEQKKGLRLFRAHGLVELGKVASGSASQGLWLGDGKVGFQVVGESRSQLPGRGTVGEVGRRGR